MTSSDKELEEQLLEAGSRLIDPPSSVDELLPLLDRVENCLSKVEQSPSKSMQNALSPSLKALVADKLLKHSNVDVKVAVASCVSEITRITAPEAPYDDDQMKEVFQLIVSSFENLSDKSSRSYTKRASILETVAKVRSCVVMLDLECDGLIVLMFQHFLNAIRDHHPENVFSSMETIMALVLEESEDISVELLSPILASVKDTENVPPPARKLGERVLEICAAKLKPYLIQAVKSLGISLGDYSSIVASVCQEGSGSNEQNDLGAAGKDLAHENQPHTPSVDEAAQVDTGEPTEVALIKQVDNAIDKSPKSVMSNGTVQTGVADGVADLNNMKKKEGHQNDQSKGVNTARITERDNLDSENTVSAEHKPELSSEHHDDDKKESENLPDHKSPREDARSSPNEGPVEPLPLEDENESDVKPSPPKELVKESASAASPSLSESLPNERRPERTGQKKKIETSDKKAGPSADTFKKASKGISSSDVKPNKRSGKKSPAATSKNNKIAVTEDASKKGSDTTSVSEEKILKRSAKRTDRDSKDSGGSSLKVARNKKRQGWGKTTSRTNVKKSLEKDDDKEILSSPKSASKLEENEDEDDMEETPKKNSKRKLTPGKEKESGSKDSGDNLVGSKIKVWWPDDEMFYEGVIGSFDHVKKKHKVLYTDGDIEILNLKKERWEFIGEDSGSGQGKAGDETSPCASADMPQKKKSKINSEESNKQEKVDASAKKGKTTSSGKSKWGAMKPGQNSKEGGSKDNSSKSIRKSFDDSTSKSKDHSKSKDDDSSTPKASTKLKLETPKSGKTKREMTPKTASISKGKPPKSGDKSNVNGSKKGKSGSLKTKESGGDGKDSSTDSAKLPEATKRKSPTSSKAKGSEAKKRRKKRG